MVTTLVQCATETFELEQYKKQKTAVILRKLETILENDNLEVLRKIEGMYKSYPSGINSKLPKPSKISDYFSIAGLY